MIPMGFNPDQQEEEEEDPPVPSNSQPGPCIRWKRIKTEKLREEKHLDPQRQTRRLIPDWSRTWDPDAPRPDLSQFPSGLKPSDLGPVQSISVVPGFSRISVFLPAGMIRLSLRSSSSSFPVEMQPGEPRQQHRSPAAFSPGNRQRKAGGLGAGRRRLMLGGLIPGQGCTRCPLDLRRQTCCCNLTAPPLCLRAGQSQRCRG